MKFDVICSILSIIPSIMSIFVAYCKKMSKADMKSSFDYEMLFIIMGFIFFPDNEYVRVTMGAFVCCVIGLNYRRISSGKEFGGLLFPSLFFFNLTTFSGINKFENIMMLAYSVVGELYLVGLIDEKDDVDTDFLVNRTRFCLVLSFVMFFMSKLIVGLLQVLY